MGVMHGPDGLVDALLNNASKLIEPRFYFQCVDYVAESLTRLKDDTCDDSFWKKNKLDCARVSEVLEEEEKSITKWDLGPATDKPNTPVTDDVISAAEGLDLKSTDFIWEIHTYAKRNLRNLKYLADRSDRKTLAEKTVKDLNSLNQVYPGRGNEQVEMRRTIKNFKKSIYCSSDTLMAE